MSEAEREDPRIIASLHPNDFEILPIQTSWEGPCWISAFSVFRPKSDAARSALLLPIKYSFKVDAFARVPRRVQLSSQIWDEIRRIRTETPQWAEYLWKNDSRFVDSLADISGLFSPPFRFVPRSDFQTSALDEVLKHDPETMEVYVTVDSNAEGGKFYVLRIHSSLSYYLSGRNYLWFQKKIRWRVQQEEILPWFRSTIKKLPKRKQPRDLVPWEEKLLSAHPEFSLPESSSDNSWTGKPKISLVFGTVDEIGYAVQYSFDRDLIQGFMRRGNVIEIRTSVRYLDDTIGSDWTFYVFAPSNLHAEVLENMFFDGSTIYFGVGPHITGMISIHKDTVSCIGVSRDTIKKYCDRAEMRLVSYESTRFKHKFYRYLKSDSNFDGVSESI